ncbi:MAG: hypothetical protein HY812_20630 [Planctomycetes bacterium]|nr:hypothetical protein [Planctomycetota bacterium]
MRLRRLSPRTEEAYLQWMRRYHEFRGGRDPALLFLYREVPGLDVPWPGDLVRAKGAGRLPVVLSRKETRAVLAKLNETASR